MNDEQESGMNFWGVLIAIFLVIIVLGFVYWQLASQWNTYEYDKLKEELDKKENVSDDYKQGWLDCIEELERIRTKTTNITSTMGDI